MNDSFALFFRTTDWAATGSMLTAISGIFVIIALFYAAARQNKVIRMLARNQELQFELHINASLFERRYKIYSLFKKFYCTSLELFAVSDASKRKNLCEALILSLGFKKEKYIATAQETAANTILAADFTSTARETPFTFNSPAIAEAGDFMEKMCVFLCDYCTTGIIAEDKFNLLKEQSDKLTQSKILELMENELKR